MRLRSAPMTLLALAVISSNIFLSGKYAAAQEATPETAQAVMLPLAPDPAKCMAKKEMPQMKMQAIYDEVNADGVAATPEPFAEPEGEPEDAAITVAVMEVVVEVIRCNANGGNGLADANYLTEEHFRQGLREMMPEDFASYTSKTPLEPEQWLMVYAVRNARTLPDGRVAANPEIIVPGVGHFRDTLIFAQVDGRWLIDESHEGEPLYLSAGS
jgi:hypothetical protein